VGPLSKSRWHAYRIQSIDHIFKCALSESIYDWNVYVRLQLLQNIQSIDAKIDTAQDSGNLLALIESLRQKKQTLISDELGQREYAQMILQIGNGNVEDTEQISFHSHDPVNFTTFYMYKPSKCFILQDKWGDETRSDY
jgi:hypothetical protein